MKARSPAPRPRRGAPKDTRERLVRAAAAIFERDGFDGTDSNAIARAAGYSPGTFYKHFADKRAIFLAVYEEWVTHEWNAIGRTLEETSDAGARAEAIVAMYLEHHRRWRGFRASLRALAAKDRAVRSFYLAQRRRQLELMASEAPSARAADVLLLYTLERAADGLADGEAGSLGIEAAELRALLVELVRRRLKDGSRR